MLLCASMRVSVLAVMLRRGSITYYLLFDFWLINFQLNCLTVRMELILIFDFGFNVAPLNFSVGIQLGGLCFCCYRLRLLARATEREIERCSVGQRASFNFECVAVVVFACLLAFIQGNVLQESERFWESRFGPHSAKLSRLADLLVR